MADETETVEQEKDLEVLLKTEDTFPPPEDFKQQANASDPSIYDEAEQDFEAFWASWAEQLDWFEKWDTVLDWNPPWAKWFKEGKLNVSHNCLDGTSRPATATRSPTTGSARTTRAVTSPTRSCSR